MPDYGEVKPREQKVVPGSIPASSESPPRDGSGNGDHGEAEKSNSDSNRFNLNGLHSR